MPLSNLAIHLAIHGPQNAGDLRRVLKTSGSTLLRMIEAEGASLVRMGKARATRYGLRRVLPGLPARIPLYRVDEAGAVAQVATVAPLQPHATWFEPAASLIETGVEPVLEAVLFVRMMPVLADMAPSGYLGRRFAEQHPELGLPARLQDWSDDHRLVALARRGEDAPGALVLGEESLDRFLSRPPLESRVRDYPLLATLSARGGAGSSAAGEHPKFGAFRDGKHYLVKFTAGDGSPADHRWRDLLACELLALETLAESGVAAPKGRLLESGPQRFLELERFDRVGSRGRRGVLTLGPLDDELFGARDSWSAAASRLEEARLLSSADARRVRLLEAFGMQIGNGDRHFGNLAFFTDGLSARPALALAPAYDTLPMTFAPHAGLAPPLDWSPASPRAALLDVWPEAAQLAHTFWTRVAKDERISRPFRALARKI